MVVVPVVINAHGLVYTQYLLFWRSQTVCNYTAVVELQEVAIRKLSQSSNSAFHSHFELNKYFWHARYCLTERTP